jgi:hypothetical protein
VRTFKCNRREPARAERKRVDADPVAMVFWGRRRRVAMHDNSAEVAAVLQELVAYPNQVVLNLAFERHARPDTGMGEKVAADAEAGFQAPVELQVILRQQLTEDRVCLEQPGPAQKKSVLDNVRRHAIGKERGIATIINPTQPRAWFIQEGQQHVLVVSFQEDRREARWQPAYQPVHYTCRVWAAIDIVAEKNEQRFSRAACFGVAFYEVQEAVQQVHPAMNIPHGVNALAIRHTGTPVLASFDGQYNYSRIGVLPPMQQKRLAAKFRRFYRSVIGNMKWQRAIASCSEMF